MRHHPDGVSVRRLTGLALAATLMVLTTGCGYDPPAVAPPLPSGSPSSGSPSAETVGTPGPSPASATPAATVGPAPIEAEVVVEEGLSVQVPQGWKLTRLTAEAQAQALAAETDPRVQAFLRPRLSGLAAQGGVLYLHDLREVDADRVATVEIYRYDPGRTPQQVVDELVVPRLQEAGLSPVHGTATLPAGEALTLTSTAQQAGVDVRNELSVLELGPSVVSVSATVVGPTVTWCVADRAEPARSMTRFARGAPWSLVPRAHRGRPQLSGSSAPHVRNRRVRASVARTRGAAASRPATASVPARRKRPE